MRVLVVDDHSITRQSIRELLGSFLSSEVELVAEAEDGEKAVIKAREIHPDVVIMDIGLPGINGFEAMRRIKEEMPEVQVVTVTIHDNTEYREKAFKLGAAAFVTKDKVGSDLLPLLRELSRKLNDISVSSREG
ncbi:MAG: response regulator transcription factor [Chloroflexi bacterium]|nr:response regulator transcription factor [Chloroflexota bacterium]